MTIADLLKARREARDLSMRAAAKEIGVGDLTYRMWELGAWRPGQENWSRIADWAKVPTPVVLGAVGVLTEAQVQALLSSEAGV